MSTPLFYILGATWLLLPFAGLAFYYYRIAIRLESATASRIRDHRVTENANPDFVFDGSKAKVVKRTRSYYVHNFEVHNFVLTQFMRMPSGQLFVVKATPREGVHLCKPVTLELEGTVLGKHAM